MLERKCSSAAMESAARSQFIKRLMTPTGSSYAAAENVVMRDPGSGEWRLVERRSMVGG